ncbi:MAG: ATP-binding protein [Pseudomonadota bacterium]|nr:ATP-binding protein [Pseudomonadota bacterium]
MTLGRLSWFRSARAAALVAALLFVIAVVAAGLRLQQEQTLQFDAYRSGSWMVANAEIELLRLEGTIRGVQARANSETIDHLWLQFDIFWSRIPLVLESDEAKGVRKLDGVVDTFQRIRDRLPDWEVAIDRAISSGNYFELDAVADELDAFRDPVHGFVTRTLLQDETVYRREVMISRMRDLMIAFGILVAAGGLLVTILICQLRHTERLNRQITAAEQQAVAAQTRLAEVIDSVDAGITYVNAQGTIEVANDGFRRLYPELAMLIRSGMPLRELKACAVNMGLYDDGGDPQGWINERMRRHQDATEPFEQRLRDGRVMLIRERKTADGGVVTVRTDISDVRRQARSMEERLQAIEAASDGIAITSSNGHYIYVSPAYARIHGVDHPGDMLGRRWSDCFPPEENRRFAGEPMRTLKETGLWQGEAMGLRCDGSLIPLDISVRRVSSGGYVAAVRDLTAQRRQQAEQEVLKEQFVRAQKMEAIGRLAGGVAHDFNNILGAILGFATMLAEDLPQSSMERGFAEQILRAGERGKDLVQQILAFARTETAQREPVDIRRLAQDTADMLRASMPVTTRIRVSAPASPVITPGNATQLSQVLVNLCVNASDAMERQAGTLEIAVSTADGLGREGWDPQEGDEAAAGVMRLREGPEEGQIRVRLGRLSPLRTYACLSVRDSGTGISRAVAERMFDPFYTTKDHGKGTGLGLAAVQGIVMAHGGGLAVDSQVGKGAEFRIYLPLAGAETGAARGREAREGDVSGAGHLLVVDDDEAVGTQMALRLERLGYEVLLCIEPADAIEALQDSPDVFDAMLTDFAMPSMDGIELARQSRLLRPDLPIVVCTGNADAIGADRLAGAGVELFHKPVDFPALSRLLDRLTGDARGEARKAS